MSFTSSEQGSRLKEGSKNITVIVKTTLHEFQKGGVKSFTCTKERFQTRLPGIPRD